MDTLFDRARRKVKFARMNHDNLIATFGKNIQDDIRNAVYTDAELARTSTDIDIFKTPSYHTLIHTDNFLLGERTLSKDDRTTIKEDIEQWLTTQGPLKFSWQDDVLTISWGLPDID